MNSVSTATKGWPFNLSQNAASSAVVVIGVIGCYSPAHGRVCKLRMSRASALPCLNGLGRTEPTA